MDDDIAIYQDLFVSHTVKRAAYLAGISRSTIYELFKRDELEKVKEGCQSAGNLDPRSASNNDPLSGLSR